MYIEQSSLMPFFAAYVEDEPVGFIVLKETSSHTAEIYCMGVMKKYHRQQLGKNCFVLLKSLRKLKDIN